MVSLRNLSAFAVLDRRTHRVKRLVRGGFVEQHAVLHLEGSRAFFTVVGGDVALSPDRRRVIGTATHSGRGVEVRLSDGVVLAEFDSVHDVSRVEWLPDDRTTHARRRPLAGVRYAPGAH